MDLALDTAAQPQPQPLKKCVECGDEWITDQVEVTCLQTGNKVVLTVIDPNPIDVDEPYIPNPCRAGKHSLDIPGNLRVYQRPNDGKVESGCRECYREYHRKAKRRRRLQRQKNQPTYVM